MNRNYTRPIIDTDWALNRETHEAVATAIHAIAGTSRSPDAIWEDPTPAEWDQVVMAVAEYIRLGDFPAEADGRYPWGLETVVLEPDMTLHAETEYRIGRKLGRSLAEQGDRLSEAEKGADNPDYLRGLRDGFAEYRAAHPLSP